MGERAENLDENQVRDELIEKLRMLLAKCWGMIVNPNLDAKTRESWIQKYTNSSLALNQILKDRQNRDWEERLREIEASRRVPSGPVRTAKRKKGPERERPNKTIEQASPPDKSGRSGS